jgi:hypothetical protein
MRYGSISLSSELSHIFFISAPAVCFKSFSIPVFSTADGDMLTT